MKCSMVKCGFWILTGFIGFMGIAICAIGLISYLMSATLVSDNTELYNSTNDINLYNRWIETMPSKNTWTIYFFNITNPEEVIYNAKPILQEIGPFVFRLEQSKKFSPLTEDTVAYDDIRTYYLESGDVDKEIYHVNIPYLMATEVMEIRENNSEYEQTMQEMMENGTFSLIEKHSVRDLLFDERVPSYSQPATYPNDIFNIFLNTNGTRQHQYVVNNGKNDIQRIGEIINIDNRNRLPWSEDCGVIKGTDASVFHPGITKGERLYTFMPELERSVYYEYEQDLDIEDVKLFKFILAKDNFAMTTENQCFCYDFCISGTFKMRDSKIVFSAPHFYQGHATLLDFADGLHPQKEKHETYVYLEPTTGTVIKATKRLQLNVHISLPLLWDFDEQIVPFLWIEESAEYQIPENVLSAIKDVILVLQVIIIGMGAIMIFIFASICGYKFYFDWTCCSLKKCCKSKNDRTPEETEMKIPV